MKNPEDTHHQCDAAIALAFTILGKRWNGVILDALNHGTLGFTALRRAVPGIGDAMLADRLSELSEAKLISRQVLDGPPVSVTYSLTIAGERLMPVLAQLGTWASQNLETARPTESS